MSLFALSTVTFDKSSVLDPFKSSSCQSQMVWKVISQHSGAVIIFLAPPVIDRDLCFFFFSFNKKRTDYSSSQSFFHTSHPTVVLYSLCGQDQVYFYVINNRCWVYKSALTLMVLRLWATIVLKGIHLSLISFGYRTYGDIDMRLLHAHTVSHVRST